MGLIENNLNIAAGAVVIQDNKFLLIKEAEGPAEGLWNFPLGRMETGETIGEVCLREVKEETGYDIELTGVIGVYQRVIQGTNIIIFMYVASVIGGEQITNNKEIADCQWFTRAELEKLDNTEIVAEEMRSVVDRAFNKPLPLDTFVEF